MGRSFLEFHLPHSASRQNDVADVVVQVLAEDVVEFMPYVFQIFSQLLELRPPGDFSEVRMSPHIVGRVRHAL